MKVALTLSAMLATSLAFAETITTQFWSLERASWNGTTVAIEGEEAKIGGYIRNPNVEYDYETLVLPDLSNVNGTITSAKLSFRATGGNTGLNNSVMLFEQTETLNPANPISYDLFGTTFWANNLGSVAVPSVVGNGTWFEIEGSNLVDYLQGVVNGNANNGMVLTGSFWHWGYTVSLDDVKLEVETTNSDSLTDVQKTLGFDDLSFWNNFDALHIAQDNTIKASGASSFHLTLEAGESTSGIFSNAFNTNNILNVGNELHIKVRSPDRSFVMGVYINNDLLEARNVPQSNNFETIVYTMTSAQQAILDGNGNTNLNIAPNNDGIGHDIWVDEISFPFAIQVK